MVVQKTILKVDVSCEKCKKKILKAVSGLQGVDKIEIDGIKGNLIVTGDADPYEIIVRTRKTGKYAEVVSIGPPQKQQEAQKKPDNNEKKTPEKKAQAQPNIHNIPFMVCPICERMPMTQWHEPNQQCCIL